MAFNKIARKDSDFYVICTFPDFCWAPPPAPPTVPPIPFPLFADLGGAPWDGQPPVAGTQFRRPLHRYGQLRTADANP